MLLFNLVFILLQTMNSDQQAADMKPLFSFGVFADAQYADIPRAGNRYYMESANKLKDACDAFGKEEVNFVINLGDLIDRDFSSFDPVTRIIKASGIKTYHVTGNHDYSVDQADKDKIPVIGRKNYYSLTYKGFRFIFLDGNEISTYAAQTPEEEKTARELLAGMKTSGMKNAMDWNGAMSVEQLKWLDSQLALAETKGQKAIISCHFPVYPEDVHNLLNYADVLPILQKHNNAIAWFAGHNHAGSYCISNNVHFVTFRGMVETPSSSSYAVVDVFSDRLEIRGSGREENRTLRF